MGLRNSQMADPREVERWPALFPVDAHDTFWQISAHRSNPTVNFSNEQWEWIEWGHKAVGYDREACQYLFGLREMAKRRKPLPLYERFGSDYNHALGGFLPSEAIGQVLYRGTIKMDSMAKFFNHTQHQHEQFQKWIEARDRNIAEGSKAYNQSWNIRVANEAATVPLLSSSSQDLINVCDDLKDVRVRFVKLEGHPLWIDPPKSVVPPSLSRRRQPINRAQNLDAPEERVPPFFPTSLHDLSRGRRIPSLVLGSLTPWNEVGMQHFREYILMRAEFLRPEFNNLPRVNTATGNIIFGPIHTQAARIGRVLHNDAADVASGTQLRLPLFGDAPRVIPRTPFLTATRLGPFPDFDQPSSDEEPPLESSHSEISTLDLDSTAHELPDNANNDGDSLEVWSEYYMAPADIRESNSRRRFPRSGSLERSQGQEQGQEQASNHTNQPDYEPSINDSNRSPNIATN